MPSDNDPRHNHHQVADKFLSEVGKIYNNTSSDTNSSSRDSSEDAGDENGRHHWGRKAEYMLASVGYCVGLGNIWRFPYVCMRNGGGAFLIPFFTSLFICALPVYLLETALGQFHGKSSLHIWSICPLFKGIGWSMNLLTFFYCWYYTIILAWTLIYLCNSFSSPLPWTLCDQSWNTLNCIVGIQHPANTSVKVNGSDTTTSSSMPIDGALLNDSNNNNNNILNVWNGTSIIDLNDAGLLLLPFNRSSSNETDTNATTAVAVSEKVSSAEEFWLHNVLERSSGLEDLGGLPWHTSVALIVANAAVLIGVIKGIRSSGKVVYVTATLPYLLLTIMLILGLTLPGSGDGIEFYIKPNFSKLLESQTWVDAFLQVFYSLGTGWGGLVTMGSYNKFKNDCMKDSIFLTICCEGTSVYGGFAIFAILGHMAHTSGVPMEAFTRSGAGLAFIVYPTAISYLPLPQLWGVLFFLMLFTLGLDTQFTCVETCLTTAADIWVKAFARWRKTISTASMAFFTLTGLLFAARGGVFIFTLIDWYIAAFTLLIQAALECIIVGWVYGADRFCRDIELMIGRPPYAIFKFCWKVVSPSILFIMFFVTLATFTSPSYGTYQYSVGAQVCGWTIAIIPFGFIVVMAIVEIASHQGTFMQRLKKSCQPSPEWGPADPLLREKYNALQQDFNAGCCSPSNVEAHGMMTV